MDNRTKYILGNWKMNMTSEEIQRFFSEFTPINDSKNSNSEVFIGIAPASPYLEKVKSISKNLIKVGAQNVHFENSGAYTGEISPSMLNDLGVSFSIVGHSERRQYYGETNEVVSKRAKACILNNIIPIICIGESREEFESGDTFKVIENQLLGSINDCLSSGSLDSKSTIFPVIAYEPVWAIGTGLSATTEQVDTVHQFILNKLSELLIKNNLEDNTISVIYGGSVNVKNCSEISKLKSVDGFLIGGSSLKPLDFSEIIKLSFN